jgi:hypothetical protein
MVTGAKWMILGGGISLVVGLLMAFVAARFGNRVLGRAGLGVAVLTPEENSTEGLEEEGLRRTADNCFYIGLVLTALGVVLQTWGGIL